MKTEQTKTQRTPRSWLWPDRTIGKAESRVLRDEHNALVNNCDALVRLLEKIGRSACLQQHIGGECICFACEANKLLARLEKE